MNAVQRFFRRYIVSTVGIVILFLTVNIALFFTILIAGSMSGSDAVFSVETFSNHIVWQDETWAADDTALSMLQEYTAWAMLLPVPTRAATAPPTARPPRPHRQLRLLLSIYPPSSARCALYDSRYFFHYIFPAGKARPGRLEQGYFPFFPAGSR